MKFKINPEAFILIKIITEYKNIFYKLERYIDFKEDIEEAGSDNYMNNLLNEGWTFELKIVDNPDLLFNSDIQKHLLDTTKSYLDVISKEIGERA